MSKIDPGNIIVFFCWDFAQQGGDLVSSSAKLVYEW